MSSEFESVFVRLRGILQKHSAGLTLIADAPDYYCLQIAFSPKLKKPFPVAWVKIGKAYVGYHFMPVYMFPKLLNAMSDKLRARMQGKSCFNFKVVDETLFKELETLTTEGLARCKKAGFGP
jgi:hypothetical protein